MEDLDFVSKRIDEELNDALTYTRKALDLKHVNGALADKLYGISQDEMKHVGILLNELYNLIEKDLNDGGPSADIQTVNDFLGRLRAEKARRINDLLAQYKK